VVEAVVEDVDEEDAAKVAKVLKELILTIKVAPRPAATVPTNGTRWVFMGVKP
jgi:hypothetical protein